MAAGAAGGGSMATSERRRQPRYSVQAPVEYTSSVTNSGLTKNVSRSGTLVEITSGLPMIKTELSLRFSFFLGSFATQFDGRVVRRTSSGFAIEFSRLDAGQREVLDRAISPA